MLPQLFSNLSKRGVIVGSLVVAYGAPITSFGRGGGLRIFLNNRRVHSFGIFPFLLLESYPRQAHFELRLEFILGQIALDPMPFRALRIKHQNRRGPGRVEAVEPRRMFLDVRLDREKIRVDEACDALIRVRLGLQPSASPSSRSRAEIEQDRPAGLLGFFQGGIDVLAPLNRHGSDIIPASQQILEIR